MVGPRRPPARLGPRADRRAAARRRRRRAPRARVSRALQPGDLHDVRAAELELAAAERVGAAERAVALSELSYLLNDNVEVITAPPQPEV